jgi:hypothetical protein
MKSRISRPRTTMTLIATLIAICFSTATAHAQSAYQAKLTLPYEVHWGTAVLHPGNYVLTFNGDNVRPVVVVRDAKTFRTIAVEPVGLEESSTGGKSALLISTHGQSRVVDSFRIAELGQIFEYLSTPAHRRAVEEARARTAKTVPIVVAEK